MKHLILLPLAFCALFYSCNPSAADKGKSDNPLLTTFDTQFEVPPFDKIKPEYYVPAFEEGMRVQLEIVDSIVNNPDAPTYDNTIDAYFNSGYLLNTVSNIFDNATSATTSDTIQKISEEIRPRLAGHKDAITMNPKLFEKIKAVYDNKELWDKDPAKVYMLEKLYNSFVQNGALLPVEKQNVLKQINQELASLIVKFDNNLLAETNSFMLVVENKEDLAGLPDDVISAAAETAKEKGKEGKWVFTTKKPSFIPFIQYADNRELRKELFNAYINRANNNNENDNKEILAKIIELRAKKAELLGYANYADYKLQNRMAGSTEKAMELLNKLWESSLAVASIEAKDLQEMIIREGGTFKLEAHDWFYYTEKLRKEKFNLDENEVRPYFKLENVIDGVFLVSNKLYGLTFTKIEGIPVPHPDAVAYEVKEEDGSHLGVLYMDFFPRESKEGGAWCSEYRGHHYYNGKEFTPITTVVCNFTKPTGDTPALLSMDETETLFHEFGHALESLMSEVPYTSSYVAQDFVELPSQIMEHWAFHPEVLNLYARHYKTNEPIPQTLIEKITSAGLFNQGFITTEYLAASLLDLAYHGVSPGTDVNVEKFEKEYFEKAGLIPEIVSRYRSTYFGHITGGYDAGYYSYIWSAVLDNDAFGLFKQNGIFDRATATSFRKNILAKDGIADPTEMFVAFMGREPDVTPLLKARGLVR